MIRKQLSRPEFVTLLALMGACGPVAPPLAAVTCTPSVDLEAVCPTTPPTGYRVERGEAPLWIVPELAG